VPGQFLPWHFLFCAFIDSSKSRGEKGAGSVRDHIWQRVVDIGNYILKSRATVRDTAKVFGVSKSTVHKDVTERLPKVNAQLADEVKKVLEFNKAERHLRGGEATRQKFRQAPLRDMKPLGPVNHPRET
jgi:putative DeoR family transcriptional regulator (stage III sporulation protein D)